MSQQTGGQLCKICGNHNETTWYTAREMMFGYRDEFRYFQCVKCECLQIAEFPPDMSKYYPDNYYSLAQNDEVKFEGVKGRLRRLSISALIFNSTVVDNILQKFYSPISLRVLKDLSVTKNSAILDVGCGSGHKFLYPLAELNFSRLAGCDPFIEKDIGYANGLTISKGDIFSITGKWDIITFHHVFEHVPDPAANLRKVSELLSEKGVCVLRMPTVSSFAWEHYKTNWVQLDAPRHFFLHSVKSVEHLAKKAGLELFRIDFDSTYKQFADSERYRLNEHLRQPRKKGVLNFLRRKMKKFQYQRLASKMNRERRGDQAAFFLKKNYF